MAARKKRRRKKRIAPTPPARPRRGLGRFFLRGLVTVLPVILTLIVFGLLFQFVKQYVTAPINSAIYWSLEHNSLGWRGLRAMGIEPYDREYLAEDSLPPYLRDLARAQGAGSPEFTEALARHRDETYGFFIDLEELGINGDRLRSHVKGVVHPVVGVLVSVLLVLWLGWVAGAFVGRKIVARLDRALHVIPVVKSVYPYTKQLVEFFFAERKFDFDTVVAVPYPSEGLWSVGFVTSSALRTLRRETGQRLVSVFVPSSPMPMTGYTVFLEAERLIPIPISVDEALRITMTGGVLIPPAERVASEAGDFLAEATATDEEDEEA